MKQITEEILNKIQICIYVSDAKTDEILFVNRKMKEEFGITDIEGKTCWQVFYKGQKKRCEFCRVPKLLKMPDTTLRWREQPPNSHQVYEKYDSLVLFQNRLCHIQQAYNITDLLRLTETASRDSLCNTWNRAEGKQLLIHRLEALTGEENCVVVLLDIDNLKHVNDFFGHSEGDFVLQRFCDFLNQQIHHPDFLFRLSGDEFVLVLSNISVRETAKKVRDWREAVEHLNQTFERPYSVSFSFGISSASAKKRCTANELLDQADDAMYEEKLRRRKSASPACTAPSLSPNRIWSMPVRSSMTP